MMILNEKREKIGNDCLFQNIDKSSKKIGEGEHG